MPLSDLHSTIDNDASDGPWEEPVDDDLAVWPASDLDYVVYLDPDHQPDLDVEEIKRQVLAEIAPLHRFVRFKTLTRETLRHWSPFSTRTVEEDFLARGFGRGPIAGVLVPHGPAALRRRQDYLTHQEAEAESLRALRCLIYVTRSALKATRKDVPRRSRDIWLRAGIEDVLTPVCGKRSRAAGDEANAPEIPLTLRDDLILAWGDFDGQNRRKVHLSIATTPHTAERLGRRHLPAWCGHHSDTVKAQIQRELQNPHIYFGRDFDPCAAVLWLCQNVMELRLALAEVDLQLMSNNPVTPSLPDNFWRERKQMRRRLNSGYKDNNPKYRVPRILPVTKSLRRRLLMAFYGGMSLPFEEGFEQEYGAVEHLARWVGTLRREGRATMDGWLARDLRDIADECLLDLHHLLLQPEWAAGCDLLAEFLPAAGWEALLMAANLIRTGEHASFDVTYNFEDLAERGIVGAVHRAEAIVEIVGPFLMLPLSTADLWEKRSRGLGKQGLYAIGDH
jgi:hypothetical protein